MCIRDRSFTECVCAAARRGESAAGSVGSVRRDRRGSMPGGYRSGAVREARPRIAVEALARAECVRCLVPTRIERGRGPITRESSCPEPHVLPSLCWSVPPP
eukprot:6439287-Prymnesium_polylepis.1